MKNRFLFVLALTAIAVSADSAHAQRRRESAITISRGAIAIEPFAGYLITPSLVDGPLGTNIGAGGAPLFGAALSLPLAPSASIVGTIGYASGDLKLGVPILGGVDLGSASSIVFDASVELRAENMMARGVRFVPFVQLGGGAIRREVGISGVKARTTDFTVSGGVGFNIPLSANSDIRVLAKDYYGKADFGSVGSYSASTDDLHTIGLSAGVRIGF